LSVHGFKSPIQHSILFHFLLIGILATIAIAFGTEVFSNSRVEEFLAGSFIGRFCVIIYVAKEEDSGIIYKKNI
jgi:hypothetical protein